MFDKQKKNQSMFNQEKSEREEHGKFVTKYTKQIDAGHRRVKQILDRHCLLLIKAEK